LIAIPSTVRCPQEIRAENHKRTQSSVYKSKAWKAAKEKFLKAFPTCCYCGEPATVPHHPTRQDYGSQAYLDEIMACEPVCRGCHLGIESGKHMCAGCGKHWTKYDLCQQCNPNAYRQMNNERRRQQEERKEAFRQEVIRLIHAHRNGIYVYVDEMCQLVEEHPKQYPLLSKFKPSGKHYKIAKTLRTLGAEKTRRNHHCKTWVLRRLNL